MAHNLTATMDGIAAALLSAHVVDHAYAWPVESVVPGDGIVGYPTDIDFDLTFGRGADRGVYPVWIMCGFTQDKATRDKVSALIAGATEIKAALDGTLSGAVDSLRVTGCTIERFQALNGPQYVMVRFDCDVVA
jgi:hypothetical protein